MDNENIFKSQYTSEQIEQAIGNALNGGGGSQLYRHTIRFRNDDAIPNSNIEFQFICPIAEPMTTENAKEFVARLCGYPNDYETNAVGFQCLINDNSGSVSLGYSYNAIIRKAYKTTYATFTTRLNYKILKYSDNVLSVSPFGMELETDTSYTDTVTPL